MHNLTNKQLTELENLQITENKRSNLQNPKNTGVAFFVNFEDTILVRANSVFSYNSSIRGVSRYFCEIWRYATEIKSVKRLRMSGRLAKVRSNDFVAAYRAPLPL